MQLAGNQSQRWVKGNFERLLVYSGGQNGSRVYKNQSEVN